MLSVRCSEGICLKNRNQEAAERCPATACYVNWLRFRWANDAEPVLRQVLTATPDVQYFVKALTKKISVALAGEQSWPETIATFRRQTLRMAPEQ